MDFTQVLGERENKRTYLITYAQADLTRFPACKSFAECVLTAFNEGESKVKVVEWACCRENHADGGQHYHMSIKLDGSRRWNPIKSFISQRYGIEVHFSAQHCGYVAAYRYVIKNKPITEVLHSPDHTNLNVIGSPKTKKAMQKFSENAKRRKSGACNNPQEETPQQPCTKSKRLSNADVASFLVQNNIRSDTQLNKIALQRHKNGESDLYKFILNRNNAKAISDLISNTWRMHEAPEIIQRENISRIDVVKKHATEACIPNCNGQWLECARQLLRWNGHNTYTFTTAIRQCLIKGRSKHTNVFIYGDTNCGKSFLFEPLELMFKAFVNPATGRYAWVGLDECEVAFLNDFRWTSECIAWSDFLLLLEGQTVHLPRPKNQYATDLVIERTNKIPFFATSKEPIQFYGRYNNRDDRECEMMASRWNTFEFTRKMTQEEIITMEPCPACFSKFVLLGSEEDA